MKNKLDLQVKIGLSSSILALGIFIPWFKIMKLSMLVEVCFGILCLFLVGYLILFLAPIIFIASQVISIISYMYMLLNYRTNKIDKKWLIILTLLLLPNIILLSDVYSIYHAVFTLDWWGQANYFSNPF